jgi:hypothetical protein
MLQLPHLLLLSVLLLLAGAAAAAASWSCCLPGLRCPPACSDNGVESIHYLTRRVSWGRGELGLPCKLHTESAWCPASMFSAGYYSGTRTACPGNKAALPTQHRCNGSAGQRSEDLPACAPNWVFAVLVLQRPAKASLEYAEPQVFRNTRMLALHQGFRVHFVHSRSVRATPCDFSAEQRKNLNLCSVVCVQLWLCHKHAYLLCSNHSDMRKKGGTEKGPAREAPLHRETSTRM